MILDWFYNYYANNMYQQVAPIEICINNSNKNHLICNQQTTIIYICVCIHTDT